MEYELRTLDETRKEIQVMTAKIEELENRGGDKAKKKRDYLQAKLAKAKRRVQLLESDKAPLKKTGSQPGAPSGAQDRAAMVQLLLDAGADIHAKDVLKSTALHFAVCQGDNKTAKVLIEKGAYINARNGFGWSPLVIAKATGNSSMETLLTGAGATMGAADQKAVNRLASSLSRLQYSSSLKRKIKPRKR